MQKESIKFQDSLYFEGMTSIRAIMEGIDSGVNDRRIVSILFDEQKISKNAKTIGYLKAVSSKYNYDLQKATSSELEKITEYSLLLLSSNALLSSPSSATIKS